MAPEIYHTHFKWANYWSPVGQYNNSMKYIAIICTNGFVKVGKCKLHFWSSVCTVLQEGESVMMEMLMF